MTVKATKAAMKLAVMYGLDLADVPVDVGVKVTVEHVKQYLEAREAAAGRVPGTGPEAPDLPEKGRGAAPDTPAASPQPPPLAAGEDLTGASVMVKGRFMGTVVGPETASDGKRLWRVKSPSHSPDCETVAYAPEDLAKAIG